ncbi:MAG: carbon-nitrogen hydrolase family protein [Cyclobacteriaceae bacterium]
MKNKTNSSRRDFLQQSTFGLGSGFFGMPYNSNGKNDYVPGKKLPREICVVSVDLVGLWPDKTTESRLKKMFERMEDVAGLQPDVLCLPELFDTMWVEEQKKLAEIAEDEKVPGPVTSRVAEFAKKNNCYVVCPIITKKEGRFYNSSLLVDRKGSIAGVYHKIHPVKTEIYPDQAFKGGGVTPGALNQPVIQTDFGKVGLQICYDANWADGWDSLRNQGAEVVFFSSAFPGGRILNYYALKNDSYIASSTGGDARIIDMSGNDFDSSSEFVRYAWAKINLEKVNVTTWPTRDRLPDVFNKYGNRLGIKVWNRTDVITIESLDPELKVAQVLKEFDIPTYADLLKKETSVQEKYRPALVKKNN